MGKHVESADIILKGEHYGYLGRFKNRKILEQGHNQTEKPSCRIQCLAASDIRKCIRECRAGEKEAPAAKPKAQPKMSKLQECMKGCEAIASPIRKRACQTGCAQA